MFRLKTLDLARIKFAFTISFHIIFPAITIGLASFLAVLEGLSLKTGNDVYSNLYHFLLKIFVVNFGMGVVSGVVMACEFGTRWSRFSDFGGAITGPLLTYEVMTAFFLEAGFLGVMLFGLNRVERGPHFFSTIMVALGSSFRRFGFSRPIAGCKLRKGTKSLPCFLTLVLVFLGYSGLGISLWPSIFPPSVSIGDAASPPQSQGFMLVGTLFVIQLILGYTVWSYYVFRGKVNEESGYH